MEKRPRNTLRVTRWKRRQLNFEIFSAVRRGDAVVGRGVTRVREARCAA